MESLSQGWAQRLIWIKRKSLPPLVLSEKVGVLNGLRAEDFSEQIVCDGVSFNKVRPPVLSSLVRY
jgi:hypothetical protein